MGDKTGACPMLTRIRKSMESAVTLTFEESVRFFKTQPGEYAAHDRFLGVTVPNIRRIAKNFPELALENIQKLITSSFNEERFLALIMLVKRYQTGDHNAQKEIFDCYIKNLTHINNWNLVDASAHHIVGHYLWAKKGGDNEILATLAQSKNLWHRRVAIVSTWYFIRQGDMSLTLKLALLLLHDKEDLMHKAVGWMLREVGKRDVQKLRDFLSSTVFLMPRTTLRYAIEHFSKEERDIFLKIFP
jgi:3-methyladenine DNA glycosylase AlkD